MSIARRSEAIKHRSANLNVNKSSPFAADPINFTSVIVGGKLFRNRDSYRADDTNGAADSSCKDPQSHEINRTAARIDSSSVFFIMITSPLRVLLPILDQF